MLTSVLDASAVLRFFDDEPGAVRVRELLRLAMKRQCKLVISAVNWGEVVYILAGRDDLDAVLPDKFELMKRSVAIVEATADRAARAGLIKIKFGIAYADAFGVELATDSPEHVLVTADYGVKAAQHDIQIEFLPSKQKP